MIQISLVCSECRGKLIQNGNAYECTSCGRRKVLNTNGKQIKEVDMNDKTKDYDQVLFG